MTGKQFHIGRLGIKLIKKIVFNLCLFSVLLANTAKAQQPTGRNMKRIPPAIIFSKILNTAYLKDQEVQMVVVTFASGEVSDGDTYPLEGIGYVLEGELQSAFNGKIMRFNKGDVFHLNPKGPRMAIKNQSKVKEAKLLFYFIGGRGQPFMIPSNSPIRRPGAKCG